MRDINSEVAGWLRDYAFVRSATQSRWGYKRAASAVLSLPAQIDSLLNPDGTLQKIPHVGPASTRVILEVLRDGASSLVDQAVAAAESRTRSDILRRRGLRSYFVSRAAAAAAMRTPQPGTDQLNAKNRERFRLLKGIEANIRADGSVDMSLSELAQLEIVVAAPHSALRSPADQTPRMIAAVQTPGVHILGHPRGRIYGSRPGVTAEWERVFSAAASAGVAIELDGDPSRQDLDFDLARRAIASGCCFAIDSDAHATDQWWYAETALAHARLAGIPRERVINCWPLARLLDWAERRSRAA